MQKTYCLKCQKEVSEETRECECGCTVFIYGDEGNFSFSKEGNVVCKCGSSKFKWAGHFDFKDKALTNFTCNCGNTIGKVSYRNMFD